MHENHLFKKTGNESQTQGQTEGIQCIKVLKPNRLVCCLAKNERDT
jgi:hypothetical protein